MVLATFCKQTVPQRPSADFFKFKYCYVCNTQIMWLHLSPNEPCPLQPSETSANETKITEILSCEITKNCSESGRNPRDDNKRAEWENGFSGPLRRIKCTCKTVKCVCTYKLKTCRPLTVALWPHPWAPLKDSSLETIPAHNMLKTLA